MSEGKLGAIHCWDRFWFQPAPIRPIARVRGVLCLLAAAYFVSAAADAEFWYAKDRTFSPDNTARFWQIAGLEAEASWSVSPLFLTDRVWIYHAYLVVGIVVALTVLSGRGGRAAAWFLWLLFVGWANRAMILSGLAETMISLGLFAAAIAPPAPLWCKDQEQRHWTAQLATRLIAVQVTLIGALTFVTMLGDRIWFSGVGAYALAAPAEDRTINWMAADSWLQSPMIHESLTHLLVIALPLGLVLAWRTSPNRTSARDLSKTNHVGQAIVLAWCLVVALLGSMWLYMAAFAAMTLAIRPSYR